MNWVAVLYYSGVFIIFVLASITFLFGIRGVIATGRPFQASGIGRIIGRFRKTYPKDIEDSEKRNFRRTLPWLLATLVFGFLFVYLIHFLKDQYPDEFRCFSRGDCQKSTIVEP